MPLTRGTRLGPYEIVSALGAGGMGEVYRATDSRLGRDVGETLAQRLEKGAMPPADVLRLGGQIADALDRAHRAGVVHRDLKPGNVMLTKSGAKLMDFGLARATGMIGAPAGGLSGAAMTQSPTVGAPLTAEGTIIGTFQYMAPEQLEGREADARSDVRALGCVLYEMTTGKRPFEGRSQASLITAWGLPGESPRKLTGDGAHPAWSPDGRRIVYSTERVPDPYSRSTNASLWVVDVATGERKRIFDGDAVQPTWSPSGKRIVFGSAVQGHRDIQSIPAEGGVARPITKDRQADWGPFWAPDGRWTYFLSDQGGSPDLWRVGIDEASGEVRGEPEPVTTGVARVMDGTISADGKRVAVTINEARGEFLRQDFDPTTGRPRGVAVTLHGSSKPMLQPGLTQEGDWITYRTGGYDLWMMRKDGTELRMITDRPELDINLPVVSPDGARIAMSVLERAGLPKLGVARVEESWFAPGKPPAPIAIDTLSGPFTPADWSLDGDSIVGQGVTAQGSVPATYSFVTHRLENYGELRGTTASGPTWLPDSRRFLY